MIVTIGGNRVSVEVQSSGVARAQTAQRAAAASETAAAASATAASTSQTAAAASATAAAASAADAVTTLSTSALKANNLSDLASASTARTNLGLGTMATQAAGAVAITGGSVTGITDIAVADGGTGASTAAAARTNLGLVIGTDVQAYDADLTTWAGVTPAAGVTTFISTPSSANLAAAVTDETGTGALVFANSPTLVSPALGTPASGVLTNATGLPISSGVSGLGTGVATFLATPSSANLASAVTDETGSGALVFGTSPTLVTPALGTPSALVLTNATGLPVAGGGTGASTAADARTNLAVVGTAALAASTGGTLVGVISDITGATSRTQQAKNRDVVSAKDLGCAVDGSTNDSTTLSAAITNATGRTIVIPAGASMKLNSAITNTTTNVTIVGEPGAVLDLSGGGSILLNPGVTALPNLSADITAGGYTATFASAHGLAEGDVFIVSNPTTYSFNEWRSEYNDGRMFKVAAVVSTTQVRFYGLSPRTFASGSVGCYKLNGGTLRLENVDIIPPNLTGSRIEFDGFSRVLMKNVRARRGGTTNDYAIILNRCYESHIEAPQGTVLNGAGLAYPIVVSSCQKGVITDLSGTYSTRHTLAFGGRAQTANTPTGAWIINGIVAENDYVNNIGAIDVHGDCEEIQYNGGVTHGVVCSGRNTRISNMRIIGWPGASGTAIVGSEISQGYQVYENLEIETWGNGSADGIIKIDLSKRNGPVDLIFRNLTIKANNPVTRLFQFVAGSASPPAHAVRIIIDGLHIAGSTVTTLFYMSGTNDVSSTFSANIRNVTGTITSPLEADLTANHYNVPIVWDMQKKGVKSHGDAAYTISPRTDVDVHIYNGANLTAARTIALLNDGSAVPGDRIKVVRTNTGSDLYFNIAAEEVTLLQNQSAEAVFVAGTASARWYFTQKPARI